MKKLDVRLLRMIKNSKGQFLSVTVIIAVALCIYVLFNMTTLNIKSAVDTYYDVTNINDIHVQLLKIPKGAINELKTIEEVKEVQGRISFDVPLRVDNKDEKVTIRLISIPEKDEKINKLYLLDGQRIKIGNDHAMLLEQFAKARNIKAGDEISPYINGRAYKLEVAGIAASSEFVYLMENDQALLPAAEKFGVAYVSEAFAQSVYGYRDSYNELLITVEDEARIDDVLDQVEKKLDKYGVKRITKLEDQLSNKMLTEKVKGIDKMASTVPVLFLMVAAVIISIMLSRIVNNDRVAIGVLKALGYGNLNILSHYTKYALAIGLMGSMIGITAGTFLAGPMIKVFVAYFNIPLVSIEVYYDFMIKAIILTGVFCIASGLFGARNVLRIMPADSMRPEAPKSGKRILLERIGFFWNSIGFSWKMVIRNIMRNKRRFIFLVLGLALTYGINTIPLYQGHAMTAMFELQYGEYQKMDYTVEFTRPMSKRVMNDLIHLIDVDKMEPKLEYPFEFSNGWRKKNVNIIGIPWDTSFYEFRDSDQREVKLQKTGITITQALAKALHVKEGDDVTIKNFLPGKEDAVVEVSNVVEQYLGMNAYMDIDVMERLLMEKGMITGVVIDSDDQVKEKLEDVKNISSVRSVSDIKNSFMEYLDTIAVAINFYMLFGGILGFAIIYNSTIISISERSMEFASLRVMGFDKKDIYRMISKENTLMTIIAMLIGVPMSIAMIRGVAQSFSSEVITFPVLLTPRIFITAAVATVVFVAGAQLATLKKIYNLNFIDALKSRIS
ncbi:ABC transporter permease [Petroclostridium sp. X23]|uniref:ABC transporter permease n=1 Tax=Petroclostridium sp. X23 TaxID=3045146 RepID=UPI0024ADD352|nr:ABC transporter permease [Petroclostridium sp. X23]WHH60885.1 ABC transporter permease [Petroclostridium sp. X23]